MQEQDKATAKDQRETDISNITDGEFKATVIRTLSGLEKSAGQHRKTLTA